MLGSIEKNPTIELFQKLFAEALGTFMLVFSVGVTQSGPTAVAPALWAAMLATGFISGAQFNPAVTVAVIVNASLTRSPELFNKIWMGVLYIGVQLISGFFGADMAYNVVNTNDIKVTHFGINSGYSDEQGFLAEMFFTAVLTGVAVIGGNLTKSSILHGGLVATTVMAGDFAIGSVTGGCFNPAVGFGINVLHKVAQGGGYHSVWLYCIAPTVGGIIGGCIATFFSVFGKPQEVLKKEQY